jgi:uncharacterized protein
MKKIIIFVVVGVLLSSCQGGPLTAGEGLRKIIPVSGGAAETGLPTGTPEPSATATPWPRATLAPAATVTRLAPTGIPTPMGELFPMSIAAMRAREYPGSQITIESELTAAASYHRYYAYYLSEGWKIYGLLTVPNGEPPEGGWPALVFNHGYIEPSAYKTTERYVAYVDRLARAGYVVFRIDYRGHDRSEGQARGAYGDPGYTVDVLNAVASLKQFPEVNPERIGMWGHSMGGYLTLRAMVISKDIKAGVIWSGVVGSYPEMLYAWPSDVAPNPGDPDSEDGWRQAWVTRFGSPPQNPDFWDSVSATSYLKDLSGPVQIQVSEQDADVPVEFSRALARRIEEACGQEELVIYPDDNHDLEHYFTMAMDRTIEFFDKYLK